jgi:hypothetical protein
MLRIQSRLFKKHLKLKIRMFKVTAIQNVQETSEIEDQNVQVSADQNVQENAPDAEATQSKKLKASKFIPLFSSKV